MIHSRPGFAPRTSDKAPSKLNADMIPALHRKPLKENTNLKELSADLLNSRATDAMAKLAKEHPAPEILVNPTPSDPPQVLKPGK